MTGKRSVGTAVILCALTVALADCSRSSVGPSEITELPGAQPQPPDGPSESPALPAEPAPPPPPPPPPKGTLIRGYVSDTAFRNVAGARVEVLDGPQAGAAATTDAAGFFSLTATVDNATRFRATKDGYLANSTPHSWAPVTASGTLFFVLTSATPPVSVAGDYTLTFIADSACTQIPSELRTRTYAATIVPDADPQAPAGTGFWARINGVSAVPGRESIPVGVSGSVVAFLMDEDGWPYFAEQVTPDRYFAYDGRVAIAVPGASLSGFSTSFHGAAMYGGPAVSSWPSVRCESRNHQLVVARR